jgi:hypothetical protein
MDGMSQEQSNSHTVPILPPRTDTSKPPSVPPPTPLPRSCSAISPVRPDTSRATSASNVGGPSSKPRNANSAPTAGPRRHAAELIPRFCPRCHQTALSNPRLHWCNECYRQYMAKWRLENPELCKEYRNRYLIRKSREKKP